MVSLSFINLEVFNYFITHEYFSISIYLLYGSHCNCRSHFYNKVSYSIGSYWYASMQINFNNIIVADFPAMSRVTHLLLSIFSPVWQYLDYLCVINNTEIHSEITWYYANYSASFPAKLTVMAGSWDRSKQSQLAMPVVHHLKVDTK